MCMVLEDFENNPEQEGLIMQVDFERAFDSVEHKFLFKTLEALGFGNYLIKLVKVAFLGCFSYANVNGYLSSPIYLLKGLHQGSPLSPILFILVAQIFSNKLQLNPNIKGIKVGEVDILLSLFADDTDIFLEASASCVAAIVRELGDFGAHSGCKANISKTKCVPLGAARDNLELLDNLIMNYGNDFVHNSFTALGVNFKNDWSIADIVKHNWQSKLEKVQSWVSIWNKRDLTIFGKCTIIKSLLFSQFTYIVVPLPRPDHSIIKKVNTIIFHFLWGCKRDKIKREVIARPKDEGGLGLFDLEDFILGLKNTLLTKLTNANFDHDWKSIMTNQLQHPNNVLISIENSLARKIVSLPRMF